LKRQFEFYLKDILNAINRIQEYTHGLDYGSFVNNYLVCDAVIRNFEVIGEASKNVPDTLKTKYPEIPWQQMYSMRNIISHEYFGIDYRNIWQIIVEDLPTNKKDLINLLEKEGFE